jgi:hypothetical protein
VKDNIVSREGRKRRSRNKSKNKKETTDKLRAKKQQKPEGFSGISLNILTLSDPMSDLVRHYDFPVPDAFLDL